MFVKGMEETHGRHSGNMSGHSPLIYPFLQMGLPLLFWSEALLGPSNMPQHPPFTETIKWSIGIKTQPRPPGEEPLTLSSPLLTKLQQQLSFCCSNASQTLGVSHLPFPLPRMAFPSSLCGLFFLVIEEMTAGKCHPHSPSIRKGCSTTLRFSKTSPYLIF